MLGAVLAASGHYSIAQAQSAESAGEQTALAVPRLSIPGASGVGLPQPLPPGEAALARRIFSLQDSGALAEAARETEKVANHLLLGTILADRYLRTSYRAGAPELTAWLARFGDQPEAGGIRELLARLSPDASAAAPAQASSGSRRAGRARATSAAQVRALFLKNRDNEAIAAATPLLSAGSLPADATQALFVAGLAAWRQAQTDIAVGFFAAAYEAASSPSARAASAFWAGHVLQRVANRGGFAMWMRRAALEGGTFYGSIAHRTLGPSLACVPDGTVGNADVDALLATPQGRRAFALLQVGEKRYAEAELRELWVDTAQDGLFDRSLVLVARDMGFGQLETEIEQRGPARPVEKAALTRLRPANGFQVDPPLVYALVRHESNFHPAAVSHTGARGLMQIMPTTAHAVAGVEATRLQDPAVNLSVGQQYLLMLADDDVISGNLIRVLASYAEGQAGLRKWVDSVRDNGDPLMFIEAIPSEGTRSFVRDALAFSWHYSAIMGVPAASLDSLAGGQYPRLIRTTARASAAAGGACAMRQ